MKYADLAAKRAALKEQREALYLNAQRLIDQQSMALGDDVRRTYQLGLSRETVYFAPRQIEVILGDDGIQIRFTDRCDTIGRLEWMSAQQWYWFAEIMNRYERWVEGFIDEMPPSGPWPPLDPP